MMPQDVHTMRGHIIDGVSALAPALADLANAHDSLLRAFDSARIELHHFSVRSEGDDAAQLLDYWAVDVPVDEASSVGTIEGVAWMMTVLVVVEVRPGWSVAK
jgi:hypothetical protein